jgi:hypothetical protein
METGFSKKRWGRAAATTGLTVFLLLVAGKARAQNYPVVALVPERVFVVRGFSFRQGDFLSIEPSFLLVPGATDGTRPLAVVARPMLGLGGSGVGIGLAPIWGCSAPCLMTDALMVLPVSVEARIERMYGPTDWRAATYFGPHLSLSAFVVKASAGWMVDLDDRRNHHLQLAIGFGF